MKIIIRMAFTGKRKKRILRIRTRRGTCGVLVCAWRARPARRQDCRSEAKKK